MPSGCRTVADAPGIGRPTFVRRAAGSGAVRRQPAATRPPRAAIDRLPGSGSSTKSGPVPKPKATPPCTHVSLRESRSWLLVKRNTASVRTSREKSRPPLGVMSVPLPML